jgi:hypothetical protein
VIQVIYEDGSKARFVNKIIQMPGKKIIAQKVLTEAEILMKPTLVEGKIVMVPLTPYPYTNEQKWEKIDEIRQYLICKHGWIINVRTAQEYGHQKGINKKTRILNDSLMDEWCIWYEDMTYLKDSLNLNNINYEDIKEDNINIFPVIPNYPGDDKVKKKQKKSK